jgi:hypothetical protein
MSKADIISVLFSLGVIKLGDEPIKRRRHLPDG